MLYKTGVDTAMQFGALFGFRNKIRGVNRTRADVYQTLQRGQKEYVCYAFAQWFVCSCSQKGNAGTDFRSPGDVFPGAGNSDCDNNRGVLANRIARDCQFPYGAAEAALCPPRNGY
jgi:hypothetical protein